MAEKKLDLDALVKRRHPEYECNEEHWKFCELSYRGGREWFTEKNLFRFFKEGESDYADRKKRSYRANHTKRVVETINEFLFKEKPIRSDRAPSLVQNFWKAPTLTGLTMDQYISEMDKWTSVFGIIYVVVDRPAGVTVLRKDEKQPYSYIVFPTHVLDMSYGEDGMLNWILIAEDYRDDSDPFASTGKMKVRFRLWDRNGWRLFEQIGDRIATIKQTDQGIHNLGRVPVFAVAKNKGSRYACTSLISDIVYMDRALVNYSSLLDEIIYEQTFSQLTLPAEALLPGTKEAKQLIASAKNRIFLYQAGSGGKPEYISPDHQQARIIIDAISRLMKDIYAITGTDYEANSQAMSTGKTYSSGKARQYDYSAIENILIEKSMVLEAAEEQMLELVLLWMGSKQEVDKDWVQYPDKFDVRGLISELEAAAMLWELTPPAEIAREQMKVIAAKMFPRHTKQQREAMIAAIEAWEPKYKVEVDQKDREVSVKEDSHELAEAQMDQDLEIEEKRIASQEKQAKENAKALAKRPAPTPAKV